MPQVNKLQRLQFEINSDDAETLRELLAETGSSSLADLMRKSLAWYKVTFDAWLREDDCFFRDKTGKDERVPMEVVFGRVARPTSRPRSNDARKGQDIE